MKRFSLLLIVFFGLQLVFAQTNRFIYQVSMKTDAKNKDDVKTEMAYLDINSVKSLFYGENRMKRDSIFQRSRETRNFDRSRMEDLRSYLDFIVEKNHSEQKTTMRQRIARDEYSYEEDRKIEWKILPETTQIDKYKAQKAETMFGGRTWYAWFASDIPFQDGPYKFSGLPGLIVKLEDSEGDYSFDLKESKKIAEIPTFQTRGNTVKVKRKDFVKQQQSFQKDPATFMMNARNAAPPPPQSRGGGRGRGFQPDPQRMKEMENRMKEEIAKFNNPIELE